MPEPSAIRPEPKNFRDAVESMLEAIPYTAEHDALIRLARSYAFMIDLDPVDGLLKFGGRLESVCVRLGVKAIKVGGGTNAGDSKLAQFRSRTGTN